MTNAEKIDNRIDRLFSRIIDSPKNRLRNRLSGETLRLRFSLRGPLTILYLQSRLLSPDFINIGIRYIQTSDLLSE